MSCILSSLRGSSPALLVLDISQRQLSDLNCSFNYVFVFVKTLRALIGNLVHANVRVHVPKQRRDIKPLKGNGGLDLESNEC